MASPPGDPRKSGPYKYARLRWLKGQPPGTPCVFCGRPVDTTLSGRHPLGPTVEHLRPVRDYPDDALDQAYWALAHKRCNDRQGAQVSNRTRHGYVVGSPRPPAVRPERRW